jgi:hypothetical protein
MYDVYVGGCVDVQCMMYVYFVCVVCVLMCGCAMYDGVYVFCLCCLCVLMVDVSSCQELTFRHMSFSKIFWTFFLV